MTDVRSQIIALQDFCRRQVKIGIAIDIELHSLRVLKSPCDEVLFNLFVVARSGCFDSELVKQGGLS